MAVVASAGAWADPHEAVLPPAFEWAGYRIAFADTAASIENVWRRLEMHETASMFQAYDYLQTWLRTSAPEAGEKAVYVTAHRGDEPAFLLPMAVVAKMGVRVLTWLGQSHANYGMAIFHPDVLATAHAEDWDVDALLNQIARRVGADVVHLDNQPATWAGHPNPFAGSMRAQRTANDTFVVRLEDDFAKQYKRLFSSRTISSLKRKQRKLDEMGKAVYAQPVADEKRRAVLDWFFAAKGEQLHQIGRESPFHAPGIRSLYHALAENKAHFMIDELAVDDALVAVGITARLGRTAYLLNTVHAGEAFARSSPGALLLHRMVADAHARGARVYDFGPGALPYKFEWEPTVVPLVSTTHLVRAKGGIAYAVLVFAGLLKAKVKRSPALLAWALRLRTLIKR